MHGFKNHLQPSFSCHYVVAGPEFCPLLLYPNVPSHLGRLVRQKGAMREANTKPKFSISSSSFGELDLAGENSRIT